MSASNYHFDGVSLVITHYNRSSSLECLLTTFESLHCTFEEVIVSDDGSKPEHLTKVQELQKRFLFTLLTVPVNKGLGHNNNVSQDAVKTEYTLYVQEDFVPRAIFPALFVKSMQIMRSQPDIDIIRYYSYFSYPYLKPYDEDFSLLNFHPEPWYATHQKFYFYSDHPHVRRSNFFENFGRYLEGIKGDTTEYRMSLSFVQKKAKGLFYTKFNEVFDQQNTYSEPSTMQNERPEWKLSKNIFVRFLRFLYLIYKFTKWSLEYVFVAQRP
jgi:glycosyltransferase involved in cell wall biosynthesis